MWNYSQTLLEHFTNPRNVGSLENPDGHSEVGSSECGDAMQLDIRVDERDRITEILFMTYGCASAIASASAMTEIVKGMTLEEAEELENDLIVEYLGGMPEEKIHCSVMGSEALRAAIADFRARRDRVRQVLGKLEGERPDLASGLRECSLPLKRAGATRVVLECSGTANPPVEDLEDYLKGQLGHPVRVLQAE